MSIRDGLGLTRIINMSETAMENHHKLEAKALITSKNGTQSEYSGIYIQAGRPFLSKFKINPYPTRDDLKKAYLCSLPIFTHEPTFIPHLFGKRLKASYKYEGTYLGDIENMDEWYRPDPPLKGVISQLQYNHVFDEEKLSVDLQLTIDATIEHLVYQKTEYWINSILLKIQIPYSQFQTVFEGKKDHCLGEIERLLKYRQQKKHD